MNKKGLLFSLFVITALSLVILTFKTKVEFKEEKKADVFAKRVEVANAFIEDMEVDLERSLYVATFRAFLGADEHLHNTEEYIGDVNNKIGELILNGTIDKQATNSTLDSTFSNWTKKMQLLSHKLNINVSFENTSIDVRHISPWVVRITVNSLVTVTDFEDKIQWNFTLLDKTDFDISDANLPDPMYFIESIQNNQQETPLLNSIRRTSFKQFWMNESNFITVGNLTNHTLGQFYRESTEAPSFLGRLSGNFSPSEHGIESFINVINVSPEIWKYSTSAGPTCVADYQFFETGCSDPHKVIKMDDKFLLDWNHLVSYNLTNLNAS